MGKSAEMRLLFLIRSLNRGGAERQLTLLAKGLKERGHDVSVAVFYAGGPFQQQLEHADVSVISLEKKGRWDMFGFLWRLQCAIREQNPCLIHSYMGSSNILSILLKPLFTKVKMVWGVRASNMDLNRYDWLAGLSYQIECRLARFADLIIANSHAGKAYALSNGFPERKVVVIPNSIDTDYFRPNPNDRARVRIKWGIREKEPLIGLVGRLDPMKGHPVFLQAAALVAHKWPEVSFVCVGDGVAEYRDKLRILGESLGLGRRLIWAGTQSDMPVIYNSLDFFVSSSSYGEGFPNVIGEAMACGVPCVVTDIGDSPHIVADTGIIIPPENINQLADACLRMLALTVEQRTIKKREARARIKAFFSVNKLLNSTESVLNRILNNSI